MISQIGFRWEKSIDGVPRSAWSACFGEADARISYDLMKAIENARLPNIELSYLVANRGADIVAVVPCYLQETYLDIIAPPGIHRLCSLVRKALPAFLRMRVFIAGNPVATGRDMVGISAAPAAEIPGTVRDVFHEISDCARRKRANLVVLKEAAPEIVDRLKPELAREFLFVPSLATASIPLGVAAGGRYVDRLRRHYRHVYRRRKKLFDDGQLTWERLDDYRQHADVLHGLYAQVQEKRRTVQRLSQEFFSELSERLQGRSFALIAKREGRPLACAVVLVCESGLFPIYIEFDYRHRDEYSLYYNTLYRVLEESEERGFSEVLLGQTANESKALIGATFTPLSLGMRPLTPVTGLILKLFHPFLFAKTALPTHRVFRETEPAPAAKRQAATAPRDPIAVRSD